MLIVLLLAAIYLLGFYVYSAIFFQMQSYLPAPFFRDVGDSFMDFYNINFYAAQKDFYTEFASFYSPLNTLIAKFFTDHKCVHSVSPFIYRACNPWSALIFVGITWTVILFLLWRALLKIEYRIFWFLIFGFSFPIAFAIERANYILIAVPILFVWLASNSRWNIIFEALLVNIKYYLILFQGFYLLHNRYGHLLRFFIISVSIIAIFGVLVGLPGIMNIPKNMLSFVGGPGVWSIFSNTTVDSYLEVWKFFSLPSSIEPALFLLIIFFKLFVLIRFWIYIKETRSTIDQHWLNFLLLVVLLLISPAPGFYGQILLIPYVTYFLSKNFFDNFDKVLLILLCLPYPQIIFNASDFSSLYLFDRSKILIQPELFLQTILQPIILLLLLIRLTNRIHPRSIDYEK